MKSFISAEDRHRKFLEITGNADAAQFLVLASEMARVADDVADGESTDPQADMARVLTLALAEIPANPFYQATAPVLRHFMASSVALWDVSNRVQGGPRGVWGFVHRNAIDTLTMQVAALCRGWRDAPAAFLDTVEMFDPANDETVATWNAERKL